MAPRVGGLNPPETPAPGHEPPRVKNSVEMLAAAKEAYRQSNPRAKGKRRPAKPAPLITKDGAIQHSNLREAFLLGSPPGACPAGVSHQWLANGEPIEVIVGEGVRYQQMYTCSSSTALKSIIQNNWLLKIENFQWEKCRARSARSNGLVKHGGSH